jgi:phospholipid/cholesterol/gamma-HCH transport system ATP-binding protein
VDSVIAECRRLACGYGDRRVLEDIDLQVRRGEIVALLGGSGSGKSTILRTMTGLLPPLSGEVRLFGEPDRQRALLRRTGMVFQQDALFGSMSLLDNTALPLRELTELPEPVVIELARMKLGLVGLSGLEQQPPSAVSGGQRKRAALARASVLDPELIFCDEPTTGLDPVLGAEIDELLLRFRDVLGITIIAVTHELASIRTIADRAVMLAGGTIRAAGTVAELAASDDQEVSDYFHRVPRQRAGETGGVVDQLRHRPVRRAG